MLRSFFFSFAVVLLLAFASSTVFAKQPLVSPTPSVAPTPTPEVKIQEINSFELFWPLTAGRTSADSFYFLKSLKEKIRGFLIFGAPQKADYEVFLATKRVLEAEKLIKEDKKDAALSTLDSAISDLNSAQSRITQSKTDKASLGDVEGNMKSRLDNIAALASWLSTKYSNFSEKLNSLLQKSSSTSSSL